MFSLYAILAWIGYMVITGNILPGLFGSYMNLAYLIFPVGLLAYRGPAGITLGTVLSLAAEFYGGFALGSIVLPWLATVAVFLVFVHFFSLRPAFYLSLPSSLVSMVLVSILLLFLSYIFYLLFSWLVFKDTLQFRTLFSTVFDWFWVIYATLSFTAIFYVMEKAKRYVQEA
ncbi:MAG TPA: hypothetical protein VJJ72_01910 [Candidatus Paceibacterota bacterium]